MFCPRCGSNNISVSVVNEVHEKANHGFLWWVLIGWWWRILWFIVFGWWYLIWRAIRGGKRIVNEQRSVCVCQNCGHRWYLR